jgi:hypothetical protein
MRNHDNGVVRHPGDLRHHPCGLGETICNNGRGRNPELLGGTRVVQTARGATPSIADG